MKKQFSMIIAIILLCMSSVLVGCNEKETQHVHSWIDATCTRARVCEICEEESGEPLGHLVRVGICPRCGEHSLELIENVTAISVSAKEISQSLYKSMNYISMSYDFKTDYYQSQYVDMAELEFLKIDKIINDGINACEDYPEFENIKIHYNYIRELFDIACRQSDGIYMKGTYKTKRDNLIAITKYMLAPLKSINEELGTWLEETDI